jgi:hypothetical protein
MSSGNHPYWFFRQHPSGDGVITRWRKKCPKYDDYAEIEFETVINTLKAIKNNRLWFDDPKLFKRMTNWEGLAELRFKNKAGKPLRVFGFFREEKQEFIMLGGAVEDNQKYDPSDIRDICIKRQKDILQERAIPIDFTFDDEEQEDDEDEYIRNLTQ